MSSRSPGATGRGDCSDPAGELRGAPSPATDKNHPDHGCSRTSPQVVKLAYTREGAGVGPCAHDPRSQGCTSAHFLPRSEFLQILGQTEVAEMHTRVPLAGGRGSPRAPPAALSRSTHRVGGELRDPRRARAWGAGGVPWINSSPWWPWRGFRRLRGGEGEEGVCEMCLLHFDFVQALRCRKVPGFPL